jgi:hypothetical protein
MRSSRGLSLVATLAAIAVLAGGAANARADGDPASDVLLFADIFLPYNAPSSPTIQTALWHTVVVAKKKHYRVKVAVIGSETDLGAVPSLMGKPQTYARFLGAELQLRAKVRLLVVMPNGFGLLHAKTAKERRALKGISIGAGTDGLVRAATTAVRKLAAATGHRLPAAAG